MKEEDPILVILYNPREKKVTVVRELDNTNLKSLFVAKMKRSCIYKLLQNRKPSEVAEEILENKQLKLI
jgi:hypothetical protein